MTEDRDGSRTISRRTALRSAAGVAGTALATGVAGTAAVGTATAQSDGPDFGGWFDNVSNFDGVVDKTGQDRVTVTVGAKGNGGNLAFGPAAIRVSPGTTVVWKWNGKGGAHNVVANDGSFKSGSATSKAGTTFEHTFESTGVTKYYCTPHKMLGMKGAVVVSESGGGGGSGGKPNYGDWFSNVSNFTGKTVDKTGLQRVEVSVGAKGNGGNLAFDPPAIRVDPGTTVVWKWTGNGGGHNVVATDGTFDSGSPTSKAGTTFEYTFENEGLYKYVCEPHKQLGMKGAVVVGSASADTGPTRPTGIPPELIGFGAVLFGLVLAPVAFGLFLKYRYPGGVPNAIASGEDSSAERAVEAPDTDEEIVEELGHDEFNPRGTLALVLVYIAILAVMWVFMYFVEFLGGGPTVIG